MNVIEEYKKPIAAICLVALIFLLCSLMSIAGVNSLNETGDKENGTTTSQGDIPKNTTSTSSNTSTVTPPTTSKGITICVDAGHGFSDKGTMSNITDDKGRPLYYESDIALDVSKYLRDRLVELGFNVVMIRENDTDTPPAGLADDNICNIERRVEWVNSQSDIDLMISIHCDSFSSSSVSGTRIYYNMETHPVTNIIGNGIASALLDKGACDRFPGIYDDSNQLYSLKHTIMPSILVECGFMTSDTDIKKLTDPEYQKLFADCIADALNVYYSDATRA